MNNANPLHRFALACLIAASLGIATPHSAEGVVVEDRPPNMVLDVERDTEGPAFLRLFSPVVAEAHRSVLRLFIDGKQVSFAVVVGEDGLAVTKASEIKGDAPLYAMREPGKTIAVQRLAADRVADVALIRIADKSLPALSFAAMPETKLGQWVIAPGPEAVPVAAGVLSASPRKVSGVRLGLVLVTSEESDELIVAQTMKGMGAAKAGLRRGDRIAKVADHPVQKFDDLLQALRGYNAGDTVDILLERSGRMMQVAVELQLKPLDPNNRTDSMNTAGNRLSQRRDGFDQVMQHDATIDPGECGGPLLDLEGRCIGLNIARAGRVEAYALPGDEVQRIIEALSAEAGIE